MTDLGGEKIGINTAVAEAIAQNGGVQVPNFVDAEQLSLIPLRKVEDGAEAVSRGSLARGVGRPPGSKNRRTQEMADYILSRYTSPLIALAETYARPVQDLAKELGCDKLEAFKLQLVAAKELAPYLHQKLPIAIDTGEKGLIHLTINAGTAAAAQQVIDDNRLQVKFLDVIDQNDIEQNQGLSELSAPNSNGSNSNGSTETPENKGKDE
jgi:hypothetical protein